MLTDLLGARNAGKRSRGNLRKGQASSEAGYFLHTQSTHFTPAMAAMRSLAR